MHLRASAALGLLRLARQQEDARQVEHGAHLGGEAEAIGHGDHVGGKGEGDVLHRHLPGLGDAGVHEPWEAVLADGLGHAQRAQALDACVQDKVADVSVLLSMCQWSCLECGADVPGWLAGWLALNRGVTERHAATAVT